MILLRNMKCRNFIAVGFCVLILMIYQAKADKEDKSEEAQENQAIQSSPAIEATDNYPNNSTNTSSSEEGPPDSHEAMHNRELKPKLTVSSADGRDKRSYQFLVGLVRNQSGFEVTKAQKDRGELEDDGQIDMKAAGDLMEMLVKISSHPKEWKSVHDMLVEIDNDLQKSKRILDQIGNSTGAKVSSLNDKKSYIIQDEKDKQQTTKVSIKDETGAIKKWPFDEHNLDISNNGVAGPTKVSYPHNFAYHRVTGKPLYHHHHPKTNSKGPPTKAYIAVSVIAPKNAIERDVDDDINLEDELRQLKPWTHQQNLRNMADIRSKWVIQSKDGDVDDRNQSIDN